MQTPWMEVVIARKWQEATDVVALELASANGSQLPAFAAGAHIDVELSEGLVRQYSLCNNPEERDRYLIAVLREPQSRGGSRAAHEQLQVGQTIRISEPRNHFPLDHEAKRTLLFAGGIGITPILCMAERLTHLGADFAMHYCARSSDKIAFGDRLRSDPLSAHSEIHLDDGPTAQRLDLDKLLSDRDASTHLYVCGPGGFIEAVLGKARAHGWSEANLHREYFVAPQSETGADNPFTIKIASSGQTIEVASGQTALEALGAAGIDIPASCEQGVCGTCVTRILQGEPDHRDVFLTDAEHDRGDQFTPCCSRARSLVLVLDL